MGEIEVVIEDTVPQTSSTGGFCKEFRKLMERLRKRKKSSCFGFGKQKNKGLDFQERRVSLLPLPTLNSRSRRAEKWDWDYYDCEDFDSMHWGDEWGQFEEPRRIPTPMKCYDRAFYNKALLIKRQIPPYNLHIYPDGESHCGTGSKTISTFPYKNPLRPHWQNDAFPERDCCDTRYYMGSHLGKNSQESRRFLPPNNTQEKYCELPNRFQSYTRKYDTSASGAYGGNKGPLSERIGTKSNTCKRKLKTFIPLNDDSANLKQGLRFRPSGKNVKWSSIKSRHERARANYEKIIEDQEERRTEKKHVWELRLKVGLCKRNLLEQQKTEITKVEDDLEKFYHLVYWIGHGQNTYNMVGRFYDMQNNRMVALKIFSHKAPPTSVERLKNKLLALAEIKCLLEMDHQNVISMLRYFEKDEKMLLVLDTCDHNLRTEISAAPKGMEEHIVQSIIHQILNGLNYCHNKKCLHRDLCPENILITIDGVIKIADFDKAIFVNEVSGIFPPGTITYGSPELLARTMDFGPIELSDVWSVGVILSELLLGAPLWNCETEKKQLNAIQEDIGFLFPRYLCHTKQNKDKVTAYLMKKFNRYSDEASSFAEDCLRIDPSLRSPCSRLIHHAFVNVLQNRQYDNPNATLAMLPLGGKILLLPHHANFINDTAQCQRPVTPPGLQQCPNIVAIESPSFEQQYIPTDEEDSDSDKESRLPCEIEEEKSIPPQSKSYESKIPRNIVKKPAPNIGPCLPHKVTSERIHEPNLNKNLKATNKDAAKYSQSQLTVKESLEKYNLHGSAGGDVDIKEEKPKPVPIKEKAKKKTPLAPGIQGLIEALPNANWNAIPVFKRHFELVKKFDPAAFRQNIKFFISALMKQISSTKTTVSGPAVKILNALLKDHGEYFYSELDKIVQTLMQKVGGPFFIEHECCNALNNLVGMAPPVKLCLAFAYKSEAMMKNPNTRYVTSFYLFQAMSNLNIENDIGVATLIQKKLTSAVFKTTLPLMQDQDPKTRRSAKGIFTLLLKHPRFMEFYKAFVPEDYLELVHKIIDEIRRQNSPVTVCK